MFRILQVENWLHHHGGEDDARVADIKARMRWAFCPESEDWQARVWAQAKEVADAALAGLGRI